MEQENSWTVFNLTGCGYDLTKNPPRMLGTEQSSDVVLLSVDHQWVLMAAADADVRINGLPAMGNLRVLQDQDEIAVASTRLFFSTETLASVCEHVGPVVRCPRCKLEVEAGKLSVICPGCKAIHHVACWGYAPTCTLCPASSALDAGYQFSPEAL